MGKFRRRLQYWIRPAQMDAELAEEMEFHRAMLGEEGRRAMGNVTLAREDSRSVWIWPWLESMWRDVVYGARAMRKQPGFTAAALVALGSGIGLNTSLYTAFHVLALRQWPVRDAGRMVSVAGGWSIAEARYLNEHAQSFEGVVAMRSAAVRLDGRKAQCYFVTGGYFQALGVEMRLGRGFRPEEDRAGDPQAVAVISYDTWQNRFGGDVSIIGRSVRMDDVPFTVIGVAARSFSGTDISRTAAWVPFGSTVLLRPNNEGWKRFLTLPTDCCSEMAARLAPGATREQAQAETKLLLGQYRPQFQMEPARVELQSTAWLERAGKKGKKSAAAAGLIFLGTMIVLLLACANVGNLLLARAAARQQEIAIRLSLGGSRGRLVRQLLSESLALALIASAIGLGIAMALPDYVVARLSHSSAMEIRPDWRVGIFAALMGVLSCVVFGLAPALHATRGSIVESLKQARGRVGSRLNLRSALLGTQVALSVVLLAAAALLIRGVQNSATMELGFRMEGMTVVSLELPASANESRRNAFGRALTMQLEGDPAFGAMAFCDSEPLSNSRHARSFRVEGEDPKSERAITAHSVSASYFRVLGIPLAAGRSFSDSDRNRPVAMVNEAVARRYWPKESAIGKTVISGQAYQIVGVVKDALTHGLEAGEQILYLPFDSGVPRILVHGDARAAQRIAAVAKEIEPRVEYEGRPLTENFERAREPGITGAVMAISMGLLALLLATIGMSGVFAYVVRQRTREIGIRMALGASPAEAVRLVLASSGKALGVGLAVGLAGAAAVSKLLEHAFVGVSGADPAAYVVVVAALATAALAASAAPARRAARVDPVKALRWD